MTANDIRNIALLGHGGSGKTSLAEQMLFMTKGTDRLGRTADGNTTCNYDAEEIKRQISISLAFAPVNYKGVKINVMDAPGNFDFSGEALSAIRAAECAVLVGAAKDGLSVGMERSWKMLGKKPRMIFINRTDEDNSDYASCLDALKGKAKLGIITNGFTALQQIRLERTGLRDHFDALVISEEVGVPKPDPRIFDYALEQAGNPDRERVLMVGDTAESDIRGGMNAGLSTVWLNAHGRTLPEGIQPTWTVTSLNELEQLLCKQ